ncbi:MAG: RHS repeat-associated core domain-containing protein, partial [Bacteroidales bacterium]
MGNLHLVLSDYRMAESDGLGVTYHSHVASAAEYYPFGMLLVEGEYKSESYRHLFNGMEQDPELKGVSNSYTTTWRQYEPRLGRWFSPDRIIKPWESRYAAFHNNPIYYTDPDGLDTTKRAKKYAKKQGVEDYSIEQGKNGSVWIEWGSSEDGVATINAKQFNRNVFEKIGAKLRGARVWFTVAAGCSRTW